MTRKARASDVETAGNSTERERNIKVSLGRISIKRSKLIPGQRLKGHEN